MIVLGIESSCDETGAALISDTKGLLADALHTQIDMHRAYGGVVPELASRDHIRRVIALTDEVAGNAVAHAMGFGLGIPVIGVHHLEGHLLAARLADPAPQFPFLALLVSGGHTQILKVASFGSYELLGETLDDAAGEAFDKTAQLLDLPYPGGPAVSALAEKGTPGAIELARPMIHAPNLSMSFSGLKTSVLTAVRSAPDPKDEQFRADLARGFVDAVVDVLAAKLVRAIKMTRLNNVVVAGGVSANKQLRARLTQEVERRRGKIFFPPMRLCTDNGAMIAAAGIARMESMTEAERKALIEKISFGVRPRWPLEMLPKAALPERLTV